MSWLAEHLWVLSVINPLLSYSKSAPLNITEVRNIHYVELFSTQKEMKNLDMWVKHEISYAIILFKSDQCFAMSTYQAFIFTFEFN